MAEHDKTIKAKLIGGADSPASKKWPKGYTVLSEVKGRTVERIEVYAALDSHCVSICFQDQTDITVRIDLIMDARLGFVVLQSDRITGDQRVLKSWPQTPE
jgi:hypothetical protein